MSKHSTTPSERDLIEDASSPSEAAGPDEVTPAGETAPAAVEDTPSRGADIDVVELTRERDEYRDRLLRKAAEFENYRRRIDRERREQAEAAAVDLITELLPLLDDLERALEADAGTEGAEAYRQGVTMIHRQLLDLLRRRGVRPIEAVGADFDPHVHQAVVHEPTDRHRDGEVMEELRQGYMLNDRLLRASMVKVAKA